MTAEQFAPGLLNAVCHSNLVRKLVQFPVRFIEGFFNHSIQVRQRGLIGHEFILLGDGAVALGDSRAPVPSHIGVDLDVEEHYYCTSVFVHPRQREELRA